MRLVLLGALVLTGCGGSPKTAHPPESDTAMVEEAEFAPAPPSRAGGGRFDDILEASRTCRGIASAMMETAADKSAVLGMAEQGMDACIADRLALLDLGLKEPAETACLRITGSGMGAIRTIRRWAESPGANEENAARRSVALIGEAEKECEALLARQSR